MKNPAAFQGIKQSMVWFFTQPRLCTTIHYAGFSLSHNHGLLPGSLLFFFAIWISKKGRS